VGTYGIDVTGKAIIEFTMSVDGFIDDQNGACRVVFYRKQIKQAKTEGLCVKEWSHEPI
jgi:hypothetical protein